MIDITTKIKQLSELMENHGDVAIPVSHVIDTLKNLNLGGAKNAKRRGKFKLSVSEMKNLTKEIASNIGNNFDTDSIEDYDLEMNGREVSLSNVTIDENSIMDDIRDAIEEFFEDSNDDDDDGDDDGDDDA